MPSKTTIANMAMTKIGEALFTDVDADSGTPADLVNAVWDTLNEEILTMGPEVGWRFTKRRFHGIDAHSATITSISQNSTDIQVTTSAAHGLIVGAEVELLGDTGYDALYDVTAVDDDSPGFTFDVTATFVATGTGTAHWRSQEFNFRYARPTCIRINSVQVGGIEITDWIREGDWILTNMESDEIDVEYVAAFADLTATDYPPHFVDILWRKLAAHLSFHFTQNRAMAEQLLGEVLEVYLPRAIAMDSREKFVQETSTAWIDAGHTRQTLE